MPQPKRGPRLGSDPKHQSLMLRGLARSLFEHERITTTEAKAKMLRPYAEKLITKAKKGGVHQLRLVAAEIESREVVHKLFSDIGPRFADRNGGYTRVLKLGPRGGDSAPMALIELVDAAATSAAASEGEAAGGRRRRLRRPGRRRGATAGDEAAAASDAGEDEADGIAGEPEAGEET